MQKRKNKYKIYFITLIYMSIVSCKDTGDTNELSFFKSISIEYKGEPKDTVNYKLFSQVEYLRDVNLNQEKEILFSRIGNDNIVFKETKYQLFYFKFKDLELPGYWGMRNDSILFVPFEKRQCPYEYLIINWNLNGYFKMDKDSPCIEEPHPLVNDRYFYKIKETKGSSTKIYHYVSPDERANITEKDHINESIPLILNLDKGKGIVGFQYNFDVERQKIIPWVKTMVDIEAMMMD